MDWWKTGFSLDKPVVDTSAAGANKMAFGWDDALLGAGTAASGLFGMFGQQKQAATQAAIASAQVKAQNAALKQGILQQREQAKGQLGAGMWSQIFGATTAPQAELERQLFAKRTELGEFLPKEAAFGREQARWETGFATDPLARLQRRQERLGRLQETIAGYRAQPTGMFGRIAQAPIESLMV